MQKEQLIAIAEKISEGNASREEMLLYVQHIDSFIAQYPEWEQVDAETRVKIEKEIGAAIRLRIEESGEAAGKEEPGILRMPVRRSVWPRIAIVAAAITTVVFGIWLYRYKEMDTVTRHDVVNDIAPGKNGATLTLANGKRILINDAVAGNIATQSGVKITKTASGQIVYEVLDDQASGEIKNTEIGYNLLSTTRGQQSQVRLPDGTLVFLNAESSLRYPASFAKSAKREVSLTGEGYFEVAKDKKHPFVVRSDGQTVEVLGTHFNINGYGDEGAIMTTLLEGSVKVEVASSRGRTTKQSPFYQVILKPNEQAVLGEGKIKVGQADVEEVVAWKNSDFIFNGEPIKSIMQKLERWYDIDVAYEGKVTEELYYARISRNRNISEVLKKLEQAQGVHFKIEGRRVIVTP